VLLEQVGNLTKEMVYYTAAAVHDARATGKDWEAVSAAAGVSVTTARERWSERRVRRLLTRRTRQQTSLPPPLTGARLPPESYAGHPDDGSKAPAPAGRASQKLAAALSHLQRRSGMTIHEAAQQADLSPSYVSRVLAGERVPGWPVVHMLATILGGKATELRVLWESAQGMAYPSRQDVHGAAQRLQDALRGLYLAAACPDLQSVSSLELSAQTAEEALGGEVVPDWSTTSALVTRLGGHPASIRPLWEEVHYAFLTSHDVFPDGGLPRSCLPGAELGGVSDVV
jgi:transcriptional regulator with XRE-family HTH domain